MDTAFQRDHSKHICIFCSWVLPSSSRRFTLNSLLQPSSEHHSKPSLWNYFLLTKQDSKHKSNFPPFFILTLKLLHRDSSGNIHLCICLLSQEDSSLDDVLSLSASCWILRLRLLLPLSLYLLNSGQSVDLRRLTEHTLFMMYMEVDVYWTLCGIYFLVFYCQTKDRSRHAAEKEAFLSCGAHILRSTSLGFSTVDVVFGFHPGLI